MTIPTSNGNVRAGAALLATPRYPKRRHGRAHSKDRREVWSAEAMPPLWVAWHVRERRVAREVLRMFTTP